MMDTRENNETEENCNGNMSDSLINPNTDDDVLSVLSVANSMLLENTVEFFNNTCTHVFPSITESIDELPVNDLITIQLELNQNDQNLDSSVDSQSLLVIPLFQSTPSKDDSTTDQNTNNAVSILPNDIGHSSYLPQKDTSGASDRTFVLSISEPEISHENNNVLEENSIKTNMAITQYFDIDSIPVMSSTDGSRSQNATADLNKGRKRKGRKRKNADQNRQIKKSRINKNEDYINSKGVTIKKRIFSYDFDCKCPKKCTEKVTAETRKKEFDRFWKSGTYDSRCLLIQGAVQEKKKTRTLAPETSNRHFTRIYKIADNIVCKKTFLNTYQISQSRVNVALAKKKVQMTNDSRGSAGGKNKLTDDKVQEVIDFIKQFPRYKSHYCRQNSDSKYLAPNLNLEKLYDLYKDTQDNYISKSSFKKIFYTKFNLHFKKPHKDTCLRCDKFHSKKHMATGRELEDLEKVHQEHLQHAESLRNQMNRDLEKAKTDIETETLTFDLQKTHNLPCIPTGTAYYKRQLNFYNFGIHCGSTGKGTFNVWLEYQASRGTQEVGSCLRRFMTEDLKPTAKHLILWADCCGGQNRSIKLVVMLLHILLNHEHLETIKLRFLQPGHTFLPNDSEFGDVECALKYNERLYTDSDYVKVMNECRRKKKFIVKKMESKDFLSVEPLLKCITNRKKDVDKKQVSWLNTFEIRLEKEFPTKIFMKSRLDDLSQIIDISKQARRGRSVPTLPTEIKDVELPLLWPDGKELSKAKVEDLKELLKLVPQDCANFYNFLNHVNSRDFEDDVDGFSCDLDFQIEEDED